MAEINLSVEVYTCSCLMSMCVCVCVSVHMFMCQPVTPADHKFVFPINCVYNLFHVSACLQTSDLVWNTKELRTDVPEGRSQLINNSTYYFQGLHWGVIYKNRYFFQLYKCN